MSARHEVDTNSVWLGLLQPVGVVVSPPALAQAQAWPDTNTSPLRERFTELVTKTPAGKAVLDFPRFTREFLGWTEGDLVPLGDLPAALSVSLREYGNETLAPTWAVPQARDAVPEGEVPEGARWLMLISQQPVGWNLDVTHGQTSGAQEGTRFRATPEVRFERLLREVGVPLGLLVNGTSLRIVYRPAGESSGHVTFPVQLLTEPQGAFALAALVMLLGSERLFTVAPSQRLPAILKASRQFQNQVSTQLAGQVLDALWELLRGFQAAHAATSAKLLRELLNERPEEIYGGLLTVLLRLVFLLFAEDRDLLPGAPWYVDNYSVRRLCEKLRDDEVQHPESMDLRHGAWSRLLALFRLVHDGGGTNDTALPARYGRLFDADAYPFLEGRALGSVRSNVSEPLVVPRVSDGVVLRVLEKLMVLDGERLSYRSLDVEQLGSVYESMMGYTVETATGPSVALTPAHVVIDLNAVLAKTGSARVDLLDELAGCEVTGKAADAVKAATTVEGLAAALGRKVSHRTPEVLAPGALYLQPTAERRKSGSHYTPRALTSPIVKRTLDPVLAALEPKRNGVPSPEAIGALKVCDPAMGSGAFLVEACRYLAEKLVESWAVWDVRPVVPPDEDELLFARRRIAQCCLYGVDKNPFAVDLARLSLWLATLAKDHPFTFVDHCLRAGDSLVGLGRDQLEGITWEPNVKGQRSLALWADVKVAERLRAEIHRRADDDDTAAKRELLHDAECAVRELRELGDALVGVFFSERKDSDRKGALQGFRKVVETTWGQEEGEAFITQSAERAREIGAHPFHWEVEFPEVFGRENAGFDAIVGNPPFMGGTTIGTKLGADYHDAIMAFHNLRLGNADLAAFFVRRAFHSLRVGGAFGLIATNTIAQGDTRAAGLQYVQEHGGCIFDATRRYVWPGEAAVIVSLIHVLRGEHRGVRRLNGREVERITSFLFHRGGDAAPARLGTCVGRGYVGSKIYGAGFVFEEQPAKGSWPTSLMHELFAKDPRNREVVDAYMGGEEFNDSPSIHPSRHVINFREMTAAEAGSWPDLFALVRERVKPVRDKVEQRDRREIWWWHSTRVPEASAFVARYDRMLASSQVSSHLAIAFVAKGTVYANTLNLLLLHTNAGFATVQSRAHEVWSRFLGSSMKDDLRYTPSDCFETFPFPPGVLSAEDGDAEARDMPTVVALNEVGAAYHAHRAAMMIATQKGLTDTYNRFHNPDDHAVDVVELRRLHAAMDTAVLRAYGWDDLVERVVATFVEEHPETADNEATGTKKRRKRAWRLRWPDAVRDEVLARLLERNRVQAAEELAARQRAEAAAKAAKKLGKAPVKGESKAAPVLALIPRETVGSALQSLLVERGIRVEDYSAQRQVPAGVIERMLASDLPFDPSDRSTTAFALAKGTSHDPALFNQELSVIERPRQRRTRGAPQAMAARKKRGPHEP